LTGTGSRHQAAVTAHEKKLEMKGRNEAAVALFDRA
jgi:hypothetical protein